MRLLLLLRYFSLLLLSIRCISHEAQMDLKPSSSISAEMKKACISAFYEKDPALDNAKYQGHSRLLKPMQAKTEVTPYKPQQFILKNLQSGPISAMSLTTINDHFKLYEASVASFNALRRFLSESHEPALSEQQLQDVNGRLAYEYAVIVLHELFFMNTNPNATEPSDKLKSFVEEHYGKSIQALQSDIIELGQNDGGIGWITLLLNYDTEELLLGFLNGNDISAIATLHPLLVIDMWEHGFIRDFGITGRKEYLTNYVRHIDWKMVQKRLDGGLKIIKKKKQKSEA
ncbi:Iron/manganese superoxide dismutase [Monocercomonoides exilis]|uniref:Iron/manganese superoxide dismutase n=1 Tax=Monocercomonoides exilis TaxID=2049356 RepID=UPI003559D880|nr:Iron/manganese superoxide dismutase [Monocercomonoides exilis]|eukprot:MONOS_14972.1-p1 / transcript=MONOS_14972.1 / gene=MONOS_14972 / organism=Monocercomonoides_exilis_PA203 / gene_product=Iron/manganese superoxide dismutase / transcript_product=Iron/manganese superoxide dismutase / location=Mono_scaffold01118:4260-5566(-) / protein_length=287 / sequence_SO=supercontig / SO=protein_coding / is_pseudo=false